MTTVDLHALKTLSSIAKTLVSSTIEKKNHGFANSLQNTSGWRQAEVSVGLEFWCLPSGRVLPHGRNHVIRTLRSHVCVGIIYIGNSHRSGRGCKD